MPSQSEESSRTTPGFRTPDSSRQRQGSSGKRRGSNLRTPNSVAEREAQAARDRAQASKHQTQIAEREAHGGKRQGSGLKTPNQVAEHQAWQETRLKLQNTKLKQQRRAQAARDRLKLPMIEQKRPKKDASFWRKN